MSNHASHVQPPLQFVPPDLKPGVVRAVGGLIPLALRLRTEIAQVEAAHADRLAALYRDFEAGEARFLIAFRHPSATDPLTIWYLLSRLVPRAAREHGIPLRGHPHTYFLYDRGVPLWAGKAVGWLLPRAGGISVQRGKLDRMSLKTTRDKFVNGELPMAIAPEGATNGLNEIVSPLEPGVAQLSFWCLEDLRSAGRRERVYIVPLGIQYRYLDEPWQPIDGVLSILEEECGMAADPSGDRYARLTHIGERLLSLLEDAYRRFYQQEPGKPGEELATRLQSLLEAALRTSESYFAIQAKGSLTDRCRRIEQAGWDRIYREDLKGQTLSHVERGIADRVAEEADRRMWHMRLVESFVAVSGSYVREKPTADRFAETVNLLYKTVQRLKGAPAFTPPPLGRQRALMTVGEPILVDDRYADYTASRQGARQAVADLTQSLQQTMDAMAAAQS
ncbi:MAG TPA: 1-acyl-sn-glycerol-3-phosphate acyltransferase [Chthonomonadaceae bacterium]|nr:1-acyl-sn-glycerol-3-phosphate acyltransferase [Chthonomonadaceae bacterium]